MIQVTRLDNSKLMLNVEMIQSLQSAPDTVITFTNKVRMVVKESVEELSRKIIDYQKSVHHNPELESEACPDYRYAVN
jgi:flagellar protein FlbD